MTSKKTRRQKLNISLVFVTYSYISLRKDVRLNTTRFLIMKIPNRRQIDINHSSDIDFSGFKSLYRNLMLIHFHFLVIDTTLTLDNPISAERNLLESVKRVIKTTNDKIREKKLKNYVGRGAAKITLPYHQGI